MELTRAAESTLSQVDWDLLGMDVASNRREKIDELVEMEEGYEEWGVDGTWWFPRLRLGVDVMLQKAINITDIAGPVQDPWLDAKELN